MREEVVVIGHDAANTTFTIEGVSPQVDHTELHRGPPPVDNGITVSVVGGVHQRGTFNIGPSYRVWCVCGWKWEGEGRRQAEEAWRAHLEEVGEPTDLHPFGY